MCNDFDSTRTTTTFETILRDDHLLGFERLQLAMEIYCCRLIRLHRPLPTAYLLILYVMYRKKKDQARGNDYAVIAGGGGGWS